MLKLYWTVFICPMCTSCHFDQKNKLTVKLGHLSSAIPDITWKKTARKTETPIKLPSTVLHRKTACWWIIPTFNVYSLLIPLGIADTFQAMLFRCKFKQLAFVFSLSIHWEMKNLSRITMESFGAFFFYCSSRHRSSFPFQLVTKCWHTYETLKRHCTEIGTRL